MKKYIFTLICNSLPRSTLLYIHKVVHDKKKIIEKKKNNASKERMRVNKSKEKKKKIVYMKQ